MYLKPGGSFAFQTLLNSPTTGNLSDADALPTAVLTRNGADDGAVTVTATKLSTGRYKASGALPNTYAAGDVCQVVVTATVGGVIGASVAGEFVVDTAGHADIVTNQTALAAAITAVPGLVWDTLTATARAASSYGAKLKAWALGTDNKALLSADAANTALLSIGDEGVLTSLAAMIAANKFTASALSLAPAGGGGAGPTAVQIRQELDTNSTQFAAVLTQIALANGLAGVNQSINNPVLTGSVLTGYDLCIYDTAPHAAFNDGVTGLLHKLHVTLGYTAGVQNAQTITLIS